MSGERSMTDFNERLQKAIDRGFVRGVEETERDKKKRLLRRRSVASTPNIVWNFRVYRRLLGAFAHYFPGFEVKRFSGIEEGAAVSRDDLLPGGGNVKTFTHVWK